MTLLGTRGPCSQNGNLVLKWKLFGLNFVFLTVSQYDCYTVLFPPDGTRDSDATIHANVLIWFSHVKIPAFGHPLH